VSAVLASPADGGVLVVDRVLVDKVRALQHTLYRTAKADPGRRFHALWDKVLRRDVLWRAWSPSGTVITPGPNKPWREKPNAGGERRR
jgi:hypothetical protein